MEPPGGHPARPAVRADVGLGANVGDARLTLVAAVHALAALPGARLMAVSRLYVARPVGVADQPDFHNAVVALDVPGGPDPERGALALLIALKGIERAFGRQRRGRWGPRELDLDLLLFGDERVSVERPPDGVSIDAGHRDRFAGRATSGGGRSAVRAGTPGRPCAGSRAARVARDDRRRA